MCVCDCGAYPAGRNVSEDVVFVEMPVIHLEPLAITDSSKLGPQKISVKVARSE